MLNSVMYDRSNAMAKSKLSGSLPAKQPKKPTGIKGEKRGLKRASKVKNSDTRNNTLSSMRRGKKVHRGPTSARSR